MQVAGFVWDDGNWPKCGKHDVPRDEIEGVFDSKPYVAHDRSGSMEARFNAVGKNSLGRSIFVVFTLRTSEAGTRIRPISARYMHAKEIEAYEQTKSI